MAKFIFAETFIFFGETERTVLENDFSPPPVDFEEEIAIGFVLHDLCGVAQSFQYLAAAVDQFGGDEGLFNFAPYQVGV